MVLKVADLPYLKIPKGVKRFSNNLILSKSG